MSTDSQSLNVTVFLLQFSEIEDFIWVQHRTWMKSCISGFFVKVEKALKISFVMLSSQFQWLGVWRLNHWCLRQKTEQNTTVITVVIPDGERREAKLSYCCKVGKVDFIGSFSKRVIESPKQLLCSVCCADSVNQTWCPCLYIRRQCWLAVRRELITHSQIHSSDCKHNEFNTNKHWSAFIATDE